MEPFMAAILAVLFCGLNLLAQAVPNACAGKNLPKFDQYPGEATYEGNAHLPVLVTPLDRKYRATIRNAAAAGANFSGHYAIANWGCGTGCQEFVIVDLKTGTVYQPPFEGIGFHYNQKDTDPTPGWQCYSDLLTYRRDSSLLVVEGCRIPSASLRCGRTYFTMEAGRLREVAYDPDSLQNRRVAPSSSR
jgi:hypothetical protein